MKKMKRGYIMKEIVKKINIYQFEELTEKAQEKVKDWYLEGQDAETLSEILEEELSMLFPNSQLKVQYSLGYCQGDGVNIYGEVSLTDVFEFANKNQLNKAKYPNIANIFTEEEKKLLYRVLEKIDNEIRVILPKTNTSFYCTAADVDFIEDIHGNTSFLRLV